MQHNYLYIHAPNPSLHAVIILIPHYWFIIKKKSKLYYYLLNDQPADVNKTSTCQPHRIVAGSYIPKTKCYRIPNAWFIRSGILLYLHSVLVPCDILSLEIYRIRIEYYVCMKVWIEFVIFFPTLRISPASWPSWVRWQTFKIIYTNNKTRPKVFVPYENRKRDT